MTSPKRLAVLTAGRQDYGILRGILLGLSRDSRIDLRVWAGGMHLRERFGRTIVQVRADCLPITEELDFISEPPDAGTDAAQAVSAIVGAIQRSRPDALVLIGDRQEMLAAAMAATVERLPIAHLHGGEESEGAIDNAMRHAVTKLSHLHLVSHERHAQRVRQMGEPPETVIVVGAPGLDNRYRTDLPDRTALATSLGATLTDPVVILTIHPTTLGGADPAAEAFAVAAAMERVPATYVITQPNADEGGVAIREFWLKWAARRSNISLVDALGESRYWGFLKLAAAVVGNSSSGIIEAPEAGVPVLNIGDRQRGRLRGRGVQDVPADPALIESALRDAITPEARAAVARQATTYPDGPAAPRVVAALAEWTPLTPPRKAFRDIT